MSAFYENKNSNVISQGGALEFAAHLHGHIELVYMLEGKTSTIVDGAKATLSAGDVFVTFPNQIHQYQKIDDEKYLLFIISPESLMDINDIFQNYVPESAIVKNAARNEKLLPLLQVAFDVSNTDSTYKEIIIKGYLLAFFGELFPMMNLMPVKTFSMNTIKNILNYCSLNYKNELSLDILANDLHISKYHISHLFNEKLHMSFNKYINGLRISEACKYLLNEDYSVTDIAFLVGFNCPRTFNRAFFEQVGMTPRDYKKESLKAPGMQNL
jgi:AraC-like DNA-binding protein